MSAWVPRSIIAVVVVGVLAAIYSISVGEGGPQAVDVEGRVEVQKLIAGIRQDDARLGSPDAPVVVDLFTDLRDQGAAEFQADVIDPVIVEYVREGRAQINLRHFSFQRSAVTQPALAAFAAGAQGHQWQFAELVLRNLAAVSPAPADQDFLERIAAVTPGLDKDVWDQDFAEELQAQMDDPGYESAVDEDGRLAFELKLPAEPAVLVTGPGGSETLPPAPSLVELRAAIERVGVPPG